MTDSSFTTSIIDYPCVLSLFGDDELIFLVNQQALQAELTNMICSEADRIIDSQGRIFSIEQCNNHIELVNTGTVATAEEVSVLLQRHEFAKSEVCLTKIQFTRVDEAINALAPQ